MLSRLLSRRLRTPPGAERSPQRRLSQLPKGMEHERSVVVVASDVRWVGRPRASPGDFHTTPSGYLHDRVGPRGMARPSGDADSPTEPLHGRDASPLQEKT
jgi:hypothetical protein